ncbi:hypothetical protein V1519DRAFT_444733, partial [Lipomyces tetrasporus]
TDPSIGRTSYFPGNRLGNRTSNVAESFNSWILEARSLPVHAMVERIRLQLMLLRTERLKDNCARMASGSPKPPPKYLQSQSLCERVYCDPSEQRRVRSQNSRRRKLRCISSFVQLSLSKVGPLRGTMFSCCCGD